MVLLATLVVKSLHLPINIGFWKAISSIRWQRKMTNNEFIIPDLILDNGIARGKSPCLSPGEIIESPMEMQQDSDDLDRQQYD